MSTDPARPAELIDEDYYVDEDFINPMAPLAEEEDVPALPADHYPSTVPANNPTHRRLRAIAGAGNPYIFMVMTPAGQVALEFWGVEPENLSAVLNTVADAVVPA